MRRTSAPYNKVGRRDGDEQRREGVTWRARHSRGEHGGGKRFDKGGGGGKNGNGRRQRSRRPLHRGRQQSATAVGGHLGTSGDGTTTSGGAATASTTSGIGGGGGDRQRQAVGTCGHAVCRQVRANPFCCRTQPSLSSLCECLSFRLPHPFCSCPHAAGIRGWRCLRHRDGLWRRGRYVASCAILSPSAVLCVHAVFAHILPCFLLPLCVRAACRALPTSTRRVVRRARRLAAGR